MSTSLLEALLIGCIGVIIGAVLIHIRHKFYFGLYRKALTNLALGMMMLGTGGGFLSFYTSIGYEKNTIIKTKVEGTEGVKEGSAAPIRTLQFAVEHPGVAHILTVKPIKPVFRNAFEADVYLEISDPDRKKIFSAQPHFVPYADTRSPKMSIKTWRHRDTTFVPEKPGKYTIQVIPVTVGIPEIDIWILDPLKKDGERAFSWR